MFLQFPEPVLGRTRSTREDSVRVTESFGIGITRILDDQLYIATPLTP